ncbi:MAG: cyclic nucleotide-binding domain-containing protein [Planctomycetota bacterium]|nr:cyclic nucleotide-binding domain-containing protein [Planctomycetota bacterium]
MIGQYSELFYLLKGLKMGGTVLHIGAHPDDEEIGLLSYLNHKYGVRVVYWSATRGEGGQNKIGPYTGDALGLYRSWESDAVREKDGAECLFGPFVDFGYSKDAEEGFNKWGRENLLREIVRAIRICQPDIIVNRWTGTHVDGHGHHETIGQITEAAFDAASDPEQFPELKAQGLSSWRPLKLYLSEMRIGHLTPGSAALFGARCVDLERPGVLRINSGEYDPVSGETYQERAWMAYNRHQSQAMGWLPKPGDFYYYFSLVKSNVPVPEQELSFFDGFDPTLTGLLALCSEQNNLKEDLSKTLEEAKKQLQIALDEFRSAEPKASMTSLLNADKQLKLACEQIRESKELSKDTRQGLLYYLNYKIGRLEIVAAHCLGLQLEAIGPHPRTTPGANIEVTTRLWNHQKVPVEAVRYSLELPAGWAQQSLDPAGEATKKLAPLGERFEIQVAKDAELSCPYWLAKPRVRPYEFTWPAGEPSGRSVEAAPITALCHVTIDGHELTIRQALTCREAFPGGFRELPVQVVSPISLSPESKMELLTGSENDQSFTLKLRVENSRYKPTRGEVSITTPASWEASPERDSVTFIEHGESKSLHFHIKIPGGSPAGDYPIQVNLFCEGRVYSVFSDAVRMSAPGLKSASTRDCVKEAFILSPSEIRVSILDIKFVPNLKYAYLEGAAQQVTESLEPFGISLKKLTDREIATADLSEFDAVIVGHNGYLMREAIRKHAQRLLDYASNGGTLIVEFQGYGYQGQSFTPYPFKFTVPRDRVVYEDAPVKILDPEHFLFNHPNKIGPADFDDWVIERGLYFFGEWDSRYLPLMSCADPKEDQKEGGFLVAHYGRGTFVYNAYSFFRQLPAGNAGALRLFANLLALPEARVQERMNILRQVDIFEPLSEEELQAIARLVSELWINPGDIVCRKGEQGDSLFIVYSGALEIVDEDDNIIYCAEAGDYVGELAVLCDIPRTAMMRAQRQSQLLELKRGPVVELLDQHPQMARRFIDVLVRRLYVSNESK